MKKIKFLFSLMLVTLGLAGLASCSDDNDSNPVVTTPPTEFTVNTPASSEQYIQLSKENTVDMSWSQPNYSFVALAHYYVQVGLMKDGAIKWNTNSKTGEDSFLETSYTTCTATLNGEEIAWAINNIDGFTTASQYKDQGYRDVYFRVYSCLEDGQGDEVANSGIFSNAVTFNHMAAYNAIKEKAWIYVVGSFTGWHTPGPGDEDVAYYEPYKLLETEIGSKVYQATFDIPAGDASFRFFSKLTGWNSDYCMGPTKDDFSSKEVDLGSDMAILNQALGNFTISGYAGGKIKMTVNTNTMTAKFEQVN